MANILCIFLHKYEILVPYYWVCTRCGLIKPEDNPRKMKYNG